MVNNKSLLVVEQCGTDLVNMPFLFAVAIWLLKVASCVLLNFVPLIVPNTAAKSLEAIGETSEVILEKVVPSKGMGAS
jgi:hypothetical protein